MFTTTPEQFGSLYEDQIFKFSSTFIEDHTYAIKESNSGETIGVKKFYQTNTASVNIAPIIRPYAIPQPVSFENGFIDCENFGSIKVSVTKSGSAESGEVASDEVVFSLSKRDETEVGVVTTLNRKRTLSMNESELIVVRCEPYATICATVEQFEYGYDQTTSEGVATSTTQFTKSDDGRGFVVFSTRAEMLGGAELWQEDMERFSIAFSSVEAEDSSSFIDQVEYFVIDPPRHPMRIAWISSRGSVEHYTMPYIISELVQRDGSSIYTLRSALESYEIREAIAEAISSEVVWLVEENEYREIKVVDNQVELSPEQDLSTIQFKILYRD